MSRKLTCNWRKVIQIPSVSNVGNFLYVTVCSVAISVRLYEGTCCLLSSGQRSNERIKGTVLMSIDPFTAVCHVAICNTVNHSLPTRFDYYSTFRLCHCLLKFSIQYCRYNHCPVFSCCSQPSCNVPCVLQWCCMPTDIHISPNFDSVAASVWKCHVSAQKSTHLSIREL